MAEPVNSDKTPPVTMHQFIEFADLGEALRHAMAAGLGIADIAYIYRDAPFQPEDGRLVFTVPDGSKASFNNRGRI